MRKGSFSLSKWYLDCVTDNGDLVIGYAISARFKLLNLKYVASLTCVNNTIDEKKTFQKSSSIPLLNNSIITWNCSSLNINGEWKQNSDKLDNTLLDSDLGQIAWTCYQPSSIVKLYNNKTGHICGLGYVEKIDINIDSWSLPLNELKWGRFVSQTDNLVWLEWKGDHPRKLIYYNGKRFDQGLISDSLISIGDFLTLELSDSLLLRSGDFLSSIPNSETILKRISALKKLNFNDKKWRSKGILKIDGSITSIGWVIHEVVKFW